MMARSSVAARSVSSIALSIASSLAPVCRFQSSVQTSTGVGFAGPIDLIKAKLAALEHG